MKPEPLTKKIAKIMLNGIVERVDLDKVWVVIYAGDDEFRMKITDFLKEFEREKIQWLLEEIEREASGDLPNPSFQTKLEKATYWLGFVDGYNHAKKWIIDLIKKAFEGV